jgi:transcriptional regulator with XRE-family HTH domain
MTTEFGRRLKTARAHARLTQKQLAALAGISQGTVSELETKGHGSTNLVQIAAACQVDIHWLATGDGDMVAPVAAQALPSYHSAPPPPAPPRDFRDRREVSDSDWQTLQDLKWLPYEEREALVSELRRKANAQRDHAAEVLELLKREKHQK